MLRGNDGIISTARSVTTTSETNTEAAVTVTTTSFSSWMLAYTHMRRYRPNEVKDDRLDDQQRSQRKTQLVPGKNGIMVRDQCAGQNCLMRQR